MLPFITSRETAPSSNSVNIKNIKESSLCCQEPSSSGGLKKESKDKGTFLPSVVKEKKNNDQSIVKSKPRTLALVSPMRNPPITNSSFNSMMSSSSSTRSSSGKCMPSSSLNIISSSPLMNSNKIHHSPIAKFDKKMMDDSVKRSSSALTLMNNTPHLINNNTTISSPKNHQLLHSTTSNKSIVKSPSPNKKKRTASASITPITSSSSPSHNKCNTLASSPVLQRKLDQAHAQTRAQRKTPELPVLRKLAISTDDHNIDSDDEEKEKEEESVVHDETQSLNDSSNDIKSETEKNIDSSQVSSSSSSKKARKNSFSLQKMPRTPSLRRLRVKTLDGHGQDNNEFDKKWTHTNKKNNHSSNNDNNNSSSSRASSNSIVGNSSCARTERMKRNTDSMLEDAVIAKKLKRRLAARWEQITKRTITCSGLSDFLMKSIMEGSLDAVAAARPTSERLSHAADLAINASMEGYFVNMKNEDASQNVKQLFMESLIREEYNFGDFICHKDDEADKFYVIEEGSVELRIGDIVAGTASNGSIIGEISLVYGVPHQADVQVVTECCIVWSMDALSFRRIQAVAANESLKGVNNKDSRSNILQNLRRQVSNLSDEQESSKWMANPIHFENLSKLDLIGKGTFGSVYLVSLGEQNDESMNRSSSDGSDSKDDNQQTNEVGEKLYGLKCMSKASVVERKNEKRVLIEKNILQALNSPFIISLLGTHQDEHSIYFLSEFVPGGNLMALMIEKDILSHSESMFFCANIASALIHVHSKGFVHRDVKPENCLVAEDGYIKLCDFGMAKRLPSTVLLPNGNTEVVTCAFTMCGTPEFMAPEFVLSTGYDKGVDWWALGCILVEMYVGRSPFEFDGDLKRTFKEVCLIGMGRKRFYPPDTLRKKGMEVAVQFAEDLLTMASKRLGKKDSSEVKQHNYFSSINFDDLLEKKITPPYIPRLENSKDTSHFKKDVASKDDEELKPYQGSNEWCKDF